MSKKYYNKTERKAIGWNINQRSGLGNGIPDLVVKEIKDQDADIIVLTEIVKKGNLDEFLSAIEEIGYEHAISNNRVTNEVLIAWKKDIYSLISVDDSVITTKGNDNPNFLTVRLKDTDKDEELNVVGYRIRVGYGQSHEEYAGRAREMAVVTEKLKELSGPTIVLTDSNNLRRGAKAKEWNLNVIDEMLSEVEFVRNTPDGSSIFEEVSVRGKEYEFAEDHLITSKDVEVSDVIYDREFTARDKGIYKHGKDFCWRDKDSQTYNRTMVGYPDHAIIKGKFKTA